MDPLTLALVIFLLFEGGTGGFTTATVGHGVAAAGAAGGRSVRQSATAAYAKRATQLKKTAFGRWRLAAERRLGKAGKALGLASWQMGRTAATVAATGVVAAAKAAPGGFTRGALAAHERRQKMAAAVKGGAATIRQKVADRRAAKEVADAANPAATDPPEAATSPVADGGQPSNAAASAPPAVPANPAAIAAAGPSTSAPDGPAQGTETDMTDLSSAQEKVGVEAYLAAWDGQDGSLEGLMAEVSKVHEDILGASEANADHDPGGAQDVAGKAQAAVEALQSLGEAIGAHRGMLHQKWDGAVEQLRSVGAASSEELLGSR